MDITKKLSSKNRSLTFLRMQTTPGIQPPVVDMVTSESVSLALVSQGSLKTNEVPPYVILNCRDPADGWGKTDFLCSSIHLRTFVGASTKAIMN